MDPFPEPLTETLARLPEVEIVLNGTTITSVPLQWTPARVSSRDFVLPRRTFSKARIESSCGEDERNAVGLVSPAPPTAGAECRQRERRDRDGRACAKTGASK
jgi:hypothetical protein